MIASPVSVYYIVERVMGSSYAVGSLGRARAWDVEQRLSVARLCVLRAGGVGVQPLCATCLGEIRVVHCDASRTLCRYVGSMRSEADLISWGSVELCYALTVAHIE